MIDWLVNKIFSWESLRNAITSEVHMYDSIGRSLNSGTGAVFWSESDGWRGWEHNQLRNIVYFNDIPEIDMMSVMMSIEEMQAFPS